MRKQDVTNKEQLEEYYNKCRKIKFSEEKDKPKSIEEIFYRLNGDRESTFYTRGGNHCIQKNNSFWFKKMRSLDDFIILCKYYFPEITVKEILQFVENYYMNCTKNSAMAFKFSYCSNIRKSNFWGKTYYYNINDFYAKKIRTLGFLNFNGILKELIKKEDVEVGKN